jgi:hypothetical protein
MSEGHSTQQVANQNDGEQLLSYEKSFEHGLKAC